MNITCPPPPDAALKCAENGAEPALVFGHKNPDSDALIGALAAENLYRGRGLNVKAAVQGTPAPETKFILERFNLETPEIIDSVAGKNFFIVDFADLKQAPEDFHEGHLLGIIDHHKLGDVTSVSPVECWIWPVGSSCTVLKAMHEFFNVPIPPNLAGAMLSAILSDTVIFNSPTTTEIDKKSAKDLAEIAGVKDIEALGLEMFTAKSNLDAPAKELLYRDFKDFDMGGKKIGIGQLELVSDSLVTKEIEDALKKEMQIAKDEGRHSVVLLITDILKKGSRLYMISDDEDVIKEALKPDEKMWLDGVLSRKKQIVPPLQKAFMNN